MIERTCETCGKPFTADSAARRFCSKACWYASRRIHLVRSCDSCGREFLPTKATSQFCSRKCVSLRPSPKRKSREPKACENCGAMYGPRPSEVRSNWLKRKHCSRRCAGDAARRSVQLACDHCHRAFEAQGSRATTAKFCSLPCFHASRMLSPDARRQRHAERTLRWATANPQKFADMRAASWARSRDKALFRQRARRAARRMPKACVVCGLECPHPARGKTSSVCSRKCQAVVLRNRSRAYYHEAPEKHRRNAAARREALTDDIVALTLHLPVAVARPLIPAKRAHLRLWRELRSLK
jgi:endogenous inhibitor of DNA gyrase (YacG/DUF329 family)